MNIMSRQSVQAGDNAHLSWLDRGNIDKVSIYLSEEKLSKVAGHSQNMSNMDHLKVGVDSFSQFS